MAKDNAIKLNLPSADDLFSTQESRDDAQREKVMDIPLTEIEEFPNHPFKVKMDEAMQEMAESVKQYGVLVPGLVRPKEGGGYEMVAGHRRKMASELSGRGTIPCIIRNLTDDEATIIMVDSNLQREKILPSEKAFAYKMKLDAMRRQAGRPSKDNSVPLAQNYEGKTSRQLLGEQVGESQDQVRRYIRLTDLIPGILQMVSRFGRNYIETGHYIEKIFPFLNVRFIAVNDSFDSSDSKSSDALIVNLKNLINDFYAKDISSKICPVLRGKQERGEFIGAFAPYGYLKSEQDNHKLVIDENTAPSVRQIFLWKAEGMGNNLIARKLNEAGIVSPAVYLYQSGIKKKKPTGTGAVWQGQIIKLITANITYTGNLAQGKSKKSLHDGIPTTLIPQSEWIVVPDTHEPIIDMQTFQKVQEIKQAVREERLALNGKHAAISKNENVFKGLLYCDDCKTKMVRYKDVSKYGKVVYRFICRVYAENLSAYCSLKSVREEMLFDIVYKALQAEIALTADKRKVLERMGGDGEFQAPKKAVEDEIGKIRQRLKKVTTLKGSLFESYSDKLLSESEYLFSKKRYQDENEALQAELLRLERESLRYSQTLTPQNRWIAAFQKYEGEKAITREMALELIDSIRVYGYNTFEITWKYKDEREEILNFIEGAKNDE